jgi:arylsulfatase
VLACSLPLLAGLSTPVQSRPAAAQRPDILLIVLDDVGYADLAPFGSEIRTPNIAALAADGLRYNHFDSKAVCTATRAALLTGRNNQTVRMADLPTDKPSTDTSRDRGELPANVQLLPQALKAVGYRTYGVGKWHLGPEYEDGSPGNNGSWPLQRGFDRFYGFYQGWTDQYRPDLIEGNRSVPAPATPGYHFSVDVVDHAIADVRDAGDRPYFLYVALGAAHAPLQVPRDYIERYRGVYEKGWDAIRAERYARMKAMGVIPAATTLPPREAGDRAWDSLNDDEKAVFARYMATYAGFLEHADAQIGRLVAELKARGRYDNTVIMLLSDNGAAGEADQTGSFERMYRPNKLTPAEQRARIDELGTDKIQPEYPRPWAWAGNTPLRRYKVWPYSGGTRTPLIVSWPAAIRDKGAIRTQFVDTVDLAPTLLDAAGTQFAAKVDGIAQIPVAGRSMRRTFTDPKAPGRAIQYFELRGNRAITQGKWRAVAMHRRGTDFASDRWALFDLSTDFSESTDLADRHPAKLKELKALWWREARRYSTPALAEPPERFARRERYDDAFPKTPEGTPQP